MTILLAASLVALAVVVFIATRRVLAARAETQRIRSVFSRYVSPLIVDEIIERHDPRKPLVFAGRSGYATILVARIWNFALFAEQLEPSEVIRYINEFYTLAGRTIQKQRGMLDKFLGDGVTGAFGFPLEDPLQEEHAIRAAIDIVRLVDGMNRQWVSQGRKPLRVGIGINSGMVIAGDVGFLQRREYTVVGLPAIVASRLQERTEPMNAYIVASDTTVDPVKGTFITVPAGTVPLRGMKGNVKGYVVRGLAKVEDDTLLLPHPSAFARTRIEDSPEARPGFDTRLEAAVPQSESEAHAPTPPPAAASTPSVNKFEIPETKGFGALDDTPALPDPPFDGYYEDDSGKPPLRLPP